MPTWAIVLIVVVVVLVVLAVGAWLAFSAFVGSFKPPPPVVEQTRTVFNGTATVNAGQYASYAFSVSASDLAHARNVTTLSYYPALSVSFLATGTTVQVYVMDSAQYYNYQHGAQITVLYLSGQVYTAKQDVTISSAGSYYVVVENSNLFFTSASVSADFVLHY